MLGSSGISLKRLSQHRFRQIPDRPDDNMANPNDATIDIPLTDVPSRGQTGARKENSGPSPSGYQPPTDFPSAESNEKAGLFTEQGHGPGRRRKIHDDGTGSPIEGAEDGTLNRLGRFYKAILNFSVVTRYFIYVSPLAFLIAVPIIVGATKTGEHAEIGGVRIVWFFTWIEVVWLSLWVSKIFAHFLPFVFQFLCGIVSSGTRKYALILQALEIPISLVGWCVVSLVTFIPIMTLNPDQKAAGDTATKGWEKTIKNILFALLISSLIFLAEKTLVQLISISYHRKQLDLRIRESKRNVYLLGQLYEASRSLFPEYCKEFHQEDVIISDSILGVGREGGRYGSAMPLRFIRNVGQNVGRFGDKVTAAFGNVAQEITGKQVFDRTSAHSIVIQALERSRSTEALARRIWMSFVVEGKDALYLEDIVEVLGAGREAEAEECFAVLDRDGNGDVSLEEMILTISEFGRTRKSINKSMHDVDQAIHVLDNLLLTVACIIMVLVFISFLTSGFGTVIAAGATSLLSLSFVFATTAQEVLGSCIFLFVKHPFDVGDRVEINDKPFIVEKISLLFTVFRNVIDHRVTQVPNIVLNTNWIDNYTRSNAMREQLTLTVDFGTTFADIQLLKSEMQKFVRDKENCRDFQPDVDIEVLGLGNMDKLELRVEIRHKSNWSNETVRAARRSKFMCALVLAVRKIPIYGPGGGGAALGDMSNPTYSVSISDEQAKANRDKAAADKEAKRMIPTSEMKELRSPDQVVESEGKSTGTDFGRSPSSGTTQYRGAAAAANSEATFVEALNTRPPAMDKARVDESDLYRAPSAASAEYGLRSNENDTVSLLREPSTGRRKEGSGSVKSVPAAAASGGVPTIAEPTPPRRQPSSAQPSEYHDYADYYAGQTGHESSEPYDPTNPYGRESPSQQPRSYQSSPTVPTATSPPPLQVPPRRPVQPGNAFAQQQQQQQSSNRPPPPSQPQ